MNNKVLDIILTNPEGIEASSICSIAADQLHVAVESIQPIINELIVNNKIKIIENEKSLRYQAVDNQNMKSSETLSIIGPPQSISSMKSLHEDIISCKDEIILVLDVTAPNVFSTLEDRIQRGWKTVILLPPIKEIEKERFDVYNTIIKEWIELYKKYRGFKALEIKIARIPNRSIRTTMLTATFARINVRKIDTTTTRNGLIIKVTNNNSLYKLYKDDIYTQLENALPIFRINPLLFLRRLFFLPLLIMCFLALAIIFYNNSNPILALISSILSGILCNFTYEKIRDR